VDRGQGWFYGSGELSAIIASILLVRAGVVAPIIDLSRLMRRVRQGDLDVRSPVSRRDEIGILADGFNGMVADIGVLIGRIKTEERAKRDMELRVLQAQIKPHFLYNALNAIKWMAEIKSEKGIAKAIAALVRMLEYNLGDRGDRVPLREEIDYLRSYIHLSNLRWGNGIESEFAVTADAGGTAVLRLLLQPLAENAVVHGLAAHQGRGRIVVGAERRGDDLVIRIEDDGAGFDPASAATGGGTGGLGIRNVRERIRMEYGDPYGLTIDSAPGAGTRCELRLPFRAFEQGGGDSGARAGG